MCVYVYIYIHTYIQMSQCTFCKFSAGAAASFQAPAGKRPKDCPLDLLDLCCRMYQAWFLPSFFGVLTVSIQEPCYVMVCY